MSNNINTTKVPSAKYVRVPANEFVSIESIETVTTDGGEPITETTKEVLVNGELYKEKTTEFKGRLVKEQLHDVEVKLPLELTVKLDMRYISMIDPRYQVVVCVHPDEITPFPDVLPLTKDEEKDAEMHPGAFDEGIDQWRDIRSEKIDKFQGINSRVVVYKQFTVRLDCSFFFRLPQKKLTRGFYLLVRVYGENYNSDGHWVSILRCQSKLDVHALLFGDDKNPVMETLRDYDCNEYGKIVARVSDPHTRISQRATSGRLLHPVDLKVVETVESFDDPIKYPSESLLLEAVKKLTAQLVTDSIKPGGANGFKTAEDETEYIQSANSYYQEAFGEGVTIGLNKNPLLSKKPESVKEEELRRLIDSWMVTYFSTPTAKNIPLMAYVACTQKQNDLTGGLPRNPLAMLQLFAARANAAMSLLRVPAQSFKIGASRGYPIWYYDKQFLDIKGGYEALTEQAKANWDAEFLVEFLTVDMRASLYSLDMTDIHRSMAKKTTLFKVQMSDSPYSAKMSDQFKQHGADPDKSVSSDDCEGLALDRLQYLADLYALRTYCQLDTPSGNPKRVSADMAERLYIKSLLAQPPYQGIAKILEIVPRYIPFFALVDLKNGYEMRYDDYKPHAVPILLPLAAFEAGYEAAYKETLKREKETGQRTISTMQLDYKAGQSNMKDGNVRYPPILLESTSWSAGVYSLEAVNDDLAAAAYEWVNCVQTPSSWDQPPDPRDTEFKEVVAFTGDLTITKNLEAAAGEMAKQQKLRRHLKTRIPVATLVKRRTYGCVRHLLTPFGRLMGQSWVKKDKDFAPYMHFLLGQRGQFGADLTQLMMVGSDATNLLQLHEAYSITQKQLLRFHNKEDSPGQKISFMRLTKDLPRSTLPSAPDTWEKDFLTMFNRSKMAQKWKKILDGDLLVVPELKKDPEVKQEESQGPERWMLKFRFVGRGRDVLINPEIEKDFKKMVREYARYHWQIAAVDLDNSVSVLRQDRKLTGTADTRIEEECRMSIFDVTIRNIPPNEKKLEKI